MPLGPYASRIGCVALMAALVPPPAVAAEGGGEQPMLKPEAVEPGLSGLISADPPKLRYADLYADADGMSRVRHCVLEGFVFKSYAPPAAEQWLGIPPGDIASIAYAVLPVGYVGAWHTAPGPQWVVALSGRWSVEAMDGTVLEQGPGEVQFNSDTASRPQSEGGPVGHLTRTVGDAPSVQLIVSLKREAGADKALACKPPAR